MPQTEQPSATACHSHACMQEGSRKNQVVPAEDVQGRAVGESQRRRKHNSRRSARGSNVISSLQYFFGKQQFHPRGTHHHGNTLLSHLFINRTNATFKPIPAEASGARDTNAWQHKFPLRKKCPARVRRQLTQARWEAKAPTEDSRHNATSNNHKKHTTTLQRTAPTRAQVQSHARRWAIEIRNVSCNPNVPQITDINNGNLLPHTTRSHSSRGMATCIRRCLSKKGYITGQGLNIDFASFLAKVFFH